MKKLKPLTVVHVGLATGNTLQCPSICENDFKSFALKQLVRRNPVNVGAFHHNGLNATLAQPSSHLLKPGRGRLKRPKLALRAPEKTSAPITHSFSA